jgi:drug/metabolite transporter (DMT)-like permease
MTLPAIPALAFWYAVLGVSAVSLTLGNKWILTHWEHEGSLLAIQSGFAIVLLLVADVAKRLGGFGHPMKRLRTKQFGAYMLASFFLTLQLITSLLGLPLVTIATVTVFNNLRTLCIAVSECILLRELFTGRVVGALVLTALASTVYGVADVEGPNFHVLGYVWMVANMGAAVLAALVYRYFNPQVEQTGSGVALIENVNMLPVFLLMAGVYDFSDPALLPTLSDAGPRLWGVIALTSLSGAVIGTAYANCYRLSSATSVAVAGTVNKVIAVVLGLQIFEKRLSALEWGAIAVVIAGGALFAYERKRQNDAAKDSESANVTRAHVAEDEKAARRMEMISISVHVDDGEELTSDEEQELLSSAP